MVPIESPPSPQFQSPDLDREEEKGGDAKTSLGCDEQGSNTNPDQDVEWVTGLKLFNIMTALTLVCFLVLLDSSIVATAIPQITNQFHSLADIGWYSAAYQLGSAVLQPLSGKIYTNFSTKWTFITFFAVFEIGSLLCGVATSSDMLIVGRTVAGVGTSGLLNGAMIIVVECVPLESRPVLIGFVMGISQIGSVSGPLFGGLLTQFATWRWCFYINLPIGGVVALMLVFLRIPLHTPKPPPLSVLRKLSSHLDLVGFAIFSPALIMLLLALQWGGSKFAWNSSQIIGLFCGAGCNALVWFIWNYHIGDAAMIPRSMARQRTVWSSCVVYGLFSGQMYTASYWLPIYFQGVKGASPVMSGVDILPIIIAHIFAAVSSGPLLNFIGYWIPICLTASVFIAVGSGLISTFSPTTSTGTWIGYQIILGIGRGLGIQMPLIAVQNTMPQAQIPVAMALLMFSQSFSASLFLSFDETIFNNSFKTLLPKYAPSVNPQVVLDAGASGIRTVVNSTQLPGVLAAYAKSIDRVFYMPAGMGVACFIFAWFMGWKNVRKQKKPKDAPEA